MTALTCEATERLIGAFHDRELLASDEIAVAAHLESCPTCGAVAADVRLVGSVLRASVGRRSSSEDVADFATAVVTRLNAERAASLGMRFRLMFDDMHVIYASAGAVVSAVICVVMMLGMMRFAADSQPDSLGAIVNILAMPAECETGVEAADVGCRNRWAERFQRSNEAAEEDAVFTLDAMVMRQGRLSNLALLRSGKHGRASEQVKLIDSLLDTVYRARVELPPAGPLENVLRVVDRATVRVNRQQANQAPLQTPQKKRAASEGSAAVDETT